jgi:hypothetical protein
VFSLYACLPLLSVSGCSDPKIPSTTEIIGDTENLIVKCKNSNQKWELKCQNGKWHGKIGECTRGKFILIFSKSHLHVYAKL